jgi:hypothetical protein
LIRPSVVSAVKSGATSPIRSAIEAASFAQNAAPRALLPGEAVQVEISSLAPPTFQDDGVAAGLLFQLFHAAPALPACARADPKWLARFPV